jgi:predicted thioesterase
MDISAELIAQDGRRFTFRVEARQDGRVVMTGEHERALVQLDRFLKALRSSRS